LRLEQKKTYTETKIGTETDSKTEVKIIFGCDIEEKKMYKKYE
jgi:hypothetical protein